MGGAQENGILIASYTEDQSPKFSSFREEWRHYHPKTEVEVPADGIEEVWDIRIRPATVSLIRDVLFEK